MVPAWMHFVVAIVPATAGMLAMRWGSLGFFAAWVSYMTGFLFALHCADRSDRRG